MEIPVIQITEPDIIYENDIITKYDYSQSHLIYKSQDLGSMEEIKKRIIDTQELRDLCIFQGKMIEKLINKDKLTKQDKEYFSNFKRRKKQWLKK